MNVTELGKIQCKSIDTYKGKFVEQNVIVCDTETINGKPYTIQFYDGITKTLEYVTEKTILDCYLDYIATHFQKNLSVWFFYCQFDLPIIHYPYKDYFTFDNHQMGLGDFDFSYVSGKTWYGNHTYKNMQWHERDAYQYVFRGLAKVTKDLNLIQEKFACPSFLGKRQPKTEQERLEFEAYAIQDVVVLWELVYWILGIHRQYDVGLSVSLADLCGKIFRKHYVKDVIVPTDQNVTLASLASYHGGKTESYVDGPVVIKNIVEYDITSAYPYAMTRIGNFFDYDIERWHTEQPVLNNGVYQVSTDCQCDYKPIYTEEFKRSRQLEKQWVTGWELNSCFNHKCLSKIEIHEGYNMVSRNGKMNGLSQYVEEFFALKQKADSEKNITERLWAKLALNSLYGKFISRIMDKTDHSEEWLGGVIFHPLIATLITGFVRAYVHDIEHSCQALHTSTDSFITKQKDVDTRFQGVNGLGGLKKEYEGDVLIVRPKVYVIFDKLDVNCYHKFELDDKQKVFCRFCQAKVLKAATHGFYGSVQMLLNMWKGGQTNYVVHRMVRLKEAKRSRDPEVLPFVFKDARRSLKVDWSKLKLLEV